MDVNDLEYESGPRNVHVQLYLTKDLELSVKSLLSKSVNLDSRDVNEDCYNSS